MDGVTETITWHPFHENSDGNLVNEKLPDDDICVLLAVDCNDEDRFVKEAFMENGQWFWSDLLIQPPVSGKMIAWADIPVGPNSLNNTREDSE